MTIGDMNVLYCCRVDSHAGRQPARPAVFQAARLVRAGRRQDRGQGGTHPTPQQPMLQLLFLTTVSSSGRIYGDV